MDSQPDIDNLVDKDVRLDIKAWRERRSKAANDYFHVLTRKIAEKLDNSEIAQKNLLIARYGQGERLDDGGFLQLSLSDKVDWLEMEYLHLRPTTRTFEQNGETYRWYYVMRGSSTYDTKEMSRLINQTIDDAKILGIETLPPDEIARFIQYWQPESSKKENTVSSAV